MVFKPERLEFEPKTYFLLQLNDLLTCVTRDKEIGARTIITHFLSHAVINARTMFNLPRLAFHQEVEVTPEEIPNIGSVSGLLEFCTATIKGQGVLGMPTWLVLRLIVGEEMFGSLGAVDLEIDDPILAVVEAKQSETMTKSSPKAELLGQIRVLSQK